MKMKMLLSKQLLQLSSVSLAPCCQRFLSPFGRPPAFALASGGNLSMNDVEFTLGMFAIAQLSIV